MSTPTAILEISVALLKLLPLIAPSAGGLKDNRVERLAIVTEACFKTRHYLAGLRDGGVADRDVERDLAVSWAKAAAHVHSIDPILSQRCLLKGDYWSDTTGWDGGRGGVWDEIAINLDTVESELQRIRSQT